MNDLSAPKTCSNSFNTNAIKIQILCAMKFSFEELLEHLKIPHQITFNILPALLIFQKKITQFQFIYFTGYKSDVRGNSHLRSKSAYNRRRVAVFIKCTTVDKCLLIFFPFCNSNHHQWLRFYMYSYKTIFI